MSARSSPRSRAGRRSGRRGVLLATGGFPHDVDRRRALFPRTPTGREHWTPAPETTTGDGIDLAESVGGVFNTRLASPAAWCPVSLVSYRNGRVGVGIRTSWTGASPG